MTADIVLTPKQQALVGAFLRQRAKKAAAATGFLYQWAAQIEIEAECLRLGIKANDGRKVSAFGLRAVQRTASTKPSWGNPVLAAAAKELLTMLDPKLVEEAEKRRRKAGDGEARVKAWWAIKDYIDEAGLDAGVDLLNELVDKVSLYQAEREGMRLVLMPANVVPIGRRA